MVKTNRSTLHTVYNIQQSATQGSNDTTHSLTQTVTQDSRNNQVQPRWYRLPKRDGAKVLPTIRSGGPLPRRTNILNFSKIEVSPAEFLMIEQIVSLSVFFRGGGGKFVVFFLVDAWISHTAPNLSRTLANHSRPTDFFSDFQYVAPFRNLSLKSQILHRL